MKAQKVAVWDAASRERSGGRLFGKITVAEFGMMKGKSAPTVFYDPDRDLRCLVRGDDFSFLW